MAREAMKAIQQQPGMQLAEYALTGPKPKLQETGLPTLVGPSEHLTYLRDMKSQYLDLVIVDYSKGQMEQQVELYAEVGVPFIYGGTIGDRSAAERIVRESDVSAVIAPNMSKQLVALTAALEYISRELSGAFSGYHGHVDEDHQKAKVDPSGTGLAWMRTMMEWGIDFDDMQSIRDKEYGHAYHDVRLGSPDKSVRIGFYTRVDGRQTYADGTPDAVRYLHRKVAKGSRGEVFSMVDVLKGA